MNPPRLSLDMTTRILSDGKNWALLSVSEAAMIEAMSRAGTAPLNSDNLHTVMRGRADVVTEDAVKVTICRLRAKLRGCNLPPLICTAYALGYLLAEPIQIIGVESTMAVPVAIARQVRRALQANPNAGHLAAWFDRAGV